MKNTLLTLCLLLIPASALAGGEEASDTFFTSYRGKPQQVFIPIRSVQKELTPLISNAVTAENVTTVKALVEGHPGLHIDNYTFLKEACWRCSPELIRYFLSRSALDDSFNKASYTGNSDAGNSEVQSIFSRHNTFENAKNDALIEALKGAFFKERQDRLGIIFNMLLASGVDIHKGDDYPFLLAIDRNHVEIVKLLLKHGANVHARKDEAWRLAAAKHSPLHREMTQLLTDHCNATAITKK